MCQIEIINLIDIFLFTKYDYMIIIQCMIKNCKLILRRSNVKNPSLNRTRFGFQISDIRRTHFGFRIFDIRSGALRMSNIFYITFLFQLQWLYKFQNNHLIKIFFESPEI